MVRRASSLSLGRLLTTADFCIIMKKNKFKSFLILSSILTLFISNYSESKPMPSPTMQEALNSKIIIIGEYRGHETLFFKKIDYFNGPIAIYEKIDVLKGKNIPNIVKVRYDFSDGSACIAEENWKFSKKLMPRIGSKWILFLNPEKERKIFTTYRGDFGRMETTSKNVKKIKKYLENKALQ